MNTKNMNPIVYFVIVLFLGELGIHKFIDGKVGKGVLYLLTCGLFGIGWIIDVIKALLAIINPPAAVQTENPMIVNGNQMLTKLRGVTNDCKNVIGLNRQDALANLNPNTPIHLELTESYSQPVYLVVTNDNGIDLGEISYERSNVLYQQYSNSSFDIRIKNITGGTGDHYYGCNVIITIR